MIHHTDDPFADRETLWPSVDQHQLRVVVTPA